MGQYGFDRACFSVVFLFLLCFIACLYEANGGTDVEVLACFRPGFFKGEKYFGHLNNQNRILACLLTFFTDIMNNSRRSELPKQYTQLRLTQVYHDWRLSEPWFVQHASFTELFKTTGFVLPPLILNIRGYEFNEGTYMFTCPLVSSRTFRPSLIVPSVSKYQGLLKHSTLFWPKFVS